MEKAFVQYSLETYPRISAESREILRNALNELANAPPPRPELTFEDDRRIVRWNKGHIPFSRQAERRYRLVLELYLSGRGELSAAELGEVLWNNDTISWDVVRKLGENTENDQLEPVSFPYEISVDHENQSIKIFPRNQFWKAMES